MTEMQPFDPFGGQQQPGEQRPPPPRVSPAAPAQPIPGSQWGAQPTASRGVMVTDQRPINTAVVVIAWVVAVLTLGYMFPWAIAASRGKSNQAAVALINLFLGWTFAGWVVALVMACQAHQVAGIGGHTTVVVSQIFAPTAPQPSATPPGWYPAPDGPGQRYFDGVAWTDQFAP